MGPGVVLRSNIDQTPNVVGVGLTIRAKTNGKSNPEIESGGVGRTRTSNQSVIVKRWAKHGAAILPTSTIA
jgi:hypothetical protein